MSTQAHLQLNGEAAPMPLLDPQVSAKIGTLQSLDDAIAFRLSRLSLPCPDCTADQKCIDHACDLDLIAGYQDRYGQVRGSVQGRIRGHGP